LLVAIVHTAHLLFGAMSNALTTLNSHFVATISIAPPTGRAVGTAQASLFYILSASWVLASLALGAMGNTKTALNYTIWTVADGTLATNTLTGTS